MKDGSMKPDDLVLLREELNNTHLIRFPSFVLTAQNPRSQQREARTFFCFCFFFPSCRLRHVFTPPLTSFLLTANLHLTRASGCSAYTRNKMAAYSTLGLAHRSRSLLCLGRKAEPPFCHHCAALIFFLHCFFLRSTWLRDVSPPPVFKLLRRKNVNKKRINNDLVPLSTASNLLHKNALGLVRPSPCVCLAVSFLSAISSPRSRLCGGAHNIRLHSRSWPNVNFIL